jgi:hypothetical protein
MRDDEQGSGREDEKHERIRREEGDDYEERRGEMRRPVPEPADDPAEDEVPPPAEPGAQE